jgi:hypothetical protein
MQAKIKCSNCGAEITNLSMSWGRKQWMWVPIAMLPFIFMIFWSERPKPDYTKELSANLMDTRHIDERFDVTGKVSNKGEHEWQSVEIKAEFYDANGKFIDEGSTYLPGALRPMKEEYFKITMKKPYKELLEPSTKVIVKVAGANFYRF